jgi:hypothetical protein
MGEKDFSLEEFENEFNESWTEDDDTNNEIQTEDVEDLDTEETETEEVEETEVEEEESPQIHNEDEHKRNEAFKNLRVQAQENQKYADFIQQLAEQNGVSPQEIIERFEQRKLEEQAEKENVPVDVLKRLNSLEEENRSIKEHSFANSFNSEVDRVVSENNLSNEEVQSVFSYMHEKGYVVDGKPTVPFEDAFFLANRQNIIQREVEKTRQQELSEKKKRQTSSALPSGNNVSQTDDIDAEVDAYIKSLTRF